MPHPRFRTAPLLRQGLAAALLLASTLLAGARAPLNWGAVITDRDRTRLRDWRTNWTAAVDRARAAGAGAKIDAEGVLLQPDAAQDGGPAPDGAYRCRLVKVGGQGRNIPGFIVQPDLRCRISGHMLSVTGGPQRPNGRLYPLDSARQLFLGAFTLGDEENVMPYRRDPDRNILGILERIGPQRWRLTMPQPRWQSLLDVLDLVPDPAAPPANATKGHSAAPGA